MALVGSLLKISRSEAAADFEWRIPGSDTERLGKRVTLCSPNLYFGGRMWWLLLGSENPSSDSCPFLLSLCRRGAPPPSPLVRYWLGAVKVDGGREEEEIGRGRMDRGSYPVDHPWLPSPELRRRMGRSSPSSGDLSFVVRMRTGPETDEEMKSLVKLAESASICEVSAEKFTQTDIEDAQTSSEEVTNSAARREESTQTDSEDAQTNSEDVSNSAARREESTQTDSQDFSNMGRRYCFVPIETEDLLNIMSRRNEV